MPELCSESAWSSGSVAATFTNALVGQGGPTAKALIYCPGSDLPVPIEEMYWTGYFSSFLPAVVPGTGPRVALSGPTAWNVWIGPTVCRPSWAWRWEPHAAPAGHWAGKVVPPSWEGQVNFSQVGSSGSWPCSDCQREGLQHVWKWNSMAVVRSELGKSLAFCLLNSIVFNCSSQEEFLWELPRHCL